LASVYEIVPFWNKVVYGTAGSTNTMLARRVGLAKGDTAIHAAGSLFLKVRCARLRIDLVEVEKACIRVSVRSSFALKFDKTGGLTHD
jgi:NOL1/NOP2/fmu family ribosome biogenesis protein